MQQCLGVFSPTAAFPKVGTMAQAHNLAEGKLLMPRPECAQAQPTGIAGHRGGACGAGNQSEERVLEERVYERRDGRRLGQQDHDAKK
jgi:hypothetical protein